VQWLGPGGGGGAHALPLQQLQLLPLRPRACEPAPPKTSPSSPSPDEACTSHPPPRLGGRRSEDLYFFDAFQTSQRQEPRRPSCNTLYDVFSNIRDDEGGCSEGGGGVGWGGAGRHGVGGGGAGGRSVTAASEGAERSHKLARHPKHSALWVRGRAAGHPRPRLQRAVLTPLSRLFLWVPGEHVATMAACQDLSIVEHLEAKRDSTPNNASIWD